MNYKIPKIIWQTWRSLDMPHGMIKATESWKKKNPDFAYHFFDDQAVWEYLQEFDCTAFSFDKQALIKAFQKICPPAGKADIFRYLLLYEHGGVYADIDTICEKPLLEILDDSSEMILGYGEFNGYKTFHQWAFFCTPRNPFIKAAIEASVKNILQEYFIAGIKHVVALTGPIAFTEAINKVNGHEEGYNQYQAGRYSLAGTEVKIIEDDEFRRAIRSKYANYQKEITVLGIKKAWFLPLFNELIEETATSKLE